MQKLKWANNNLFAISRHYSAKVLSFQIHYGQFYSHLMCIVNSGENMKLL